MNRKIAALRATLECALALWLLLMIVDAALSHPLRERIAALADVAATLVVRFAQATALGWLALLVVVVLVWDVRRISRQLRPSAPAVPQQVNRYAEIYFVNKDGNQTPASPYSGGVAPGGNGGTVTEPAAPAR